MKPESDDVASLVGYDTEPLVQRQVREPAFAICPVVAIGCGVECREGSALLFDAW